MQVHGKWKPYKLLKTQKMHIKPKHSTSDYFRQVAPRSPQTKKQKLQLLWEKSKTDVFVVWDKEG